MRFLIVIFIFAAATNAFAQSEEKPVKQDFFQIFLDEPVQKVIKMQHADEDIDIEFQLTPDGKAIHILNYKGTGGVKAEVLDMHGNVQSITRSKCYIHNLQEL